MRDAVQGISAASGLEIKSSLPLLHWIDAAFMDEHGFAIALGWIEGQDRYALEIRSNDRPVPCSVFPRGRPDVTLHLASHGKTSAPQGDGFLLALAAPTSQATLELAAVEKATQRTVFTAPLDFGDRISRTAAIARLGEMAGDLSPSRVRELRAFLELAPVVVSAPPSIAELVCMGPEPVAPVLSVIVPFYRDCSYLLDHVRHQSLAFPYEVEWLFICDDPTIADEMRGFLMRRTRLISAPIKLVILERNGGYAHANNVGAAQARGRYLLLLNSDVYAETLDAFVDAIALAEEQPSIGCLGFSLLFEDKTIQHNGIAFTPYGEWGGLFIAQHPGKGAPMSNLAQAPQDCAAVTGAAMMVRKADFHVLGGLDPSFLIGDFEDADFCMRLRAQGRRIVVVPTRDLFHLERQSMRHTGARGAQAAMVLANCVLFNRRWGDVLRGTAQCAS